MLLGILMTRNLRVAGTPRRDILDLRTDRFRLNGNNGAFGTNLTTLNLGGSSGKPDSIKVGGLSQNRTVRIIQGKGPSSTTITQNGIAGLGSFNFNVGTNDRRRDEVRFTGNVGPQNRDIVAGFLGKRLKGFGSEDRITINGQKYTSIAAAIDTLYPRIPTPDPTPTPLGTQYLTGTPGNDDLGATLGAPYFINSGGGNDRVNLSRPNGEDSFADRVSLRPVGDVPVGEPGSEPQPANFVTINGFNPVNDRLVLVKPNNPNTGGFSYTGLEAGVPIVIGGQNGVIDPVFDALNIAILDFNVTDPSGTTFDLGDFGINGGLVYDPGTGLFSLQVSGEDVRNLLQFVELFSPGSNIPSITKGILSNLGVLPFPTIPTEEIPDALFSNIAQLTPGVGLTSANFEWN